jgi:hypothetical protein
LVLVGVLSVLLSILVPYLLALPGSVWIGPLCISACVGLAMILTLVHEGYLSVRTGIEYEYRCTEYEYEDIQAVEPSPALTEPGVAMPSFVCFLVLVLVLSEAAQADKRYSYSTAFNIAIHCITPQQK